MTNMLVMGSYNENCVFLSNVHNHTLEMGKKKSRTLCLKDINEPDTGEDPQYSKRSAGTRN